MTRAEDDDDVCSEWLAFHFDDCGRIGCTGDPDELHRTQEHKPR